MDNICRQCHKPHITGLLSQTYEAILILAGLKGCSPSDALLVLLGDPQCHYSQAQVLLVGT